MVSKFPEVNSSVHGHNTFSCKIYMYIRTYAKSPAQENPTKNLGNQGQEDDDTGVT